MFTNFKGQQYRGRKNEKTIGLKSNCFTGRLLSVEVDPRSWMIHEVSDDHEQKHLTSDIDQMLLCTVSISLVLVVIQILATNKALLSKY